MMKLLTKIEVVDEFDIYDITVKDDHCFELENGVIAHNSLYPKQIISGGSGLIYSCNQAFIISKAQEKEGTEVVGYNFTINIEKSRYVKEKSKFPFTVTWEKGIQRYSGLMDIALEGKFVVKPNMGWYSKVNVDTGEIEDKKYRLKDTNNSDFWDSILNNEKFKEFVKSKYEVGHSAIMANIEEDTED